jgi:hypothetical protein
VGDSRAYILRSGQLSLITKDQSLVNQLIEAGQLTEEEAEAFEHSNIILQALGTTEDVSVDLTFLELRRGDRLMLCSDGLSGLVHAEMIREALGDIPDPVQAAARLIEMANAGGGHDNVTVLCVDFAGEGLAPAAEGATAAYQQYPLPPGMPSRDSLPSLRPGLKAATGKPGADVKADTVFGEETEPVVPTRPFSWPLIVAVVLVAVVAAALAVAATREEDPPPEALEPEARIGDALLINVPEQTEEAPAAPAAGAPVEVRIDSDVNGGELFIDGESFGPIPESEDLAVQLEPGSYRFEARVDGNAVATRDVTVEPGMQGEVSLRLPTGQEAVPPTAPPATQPATRRATKAPPTTAATGRASGDRGAGVAPATTGSSGASALGASPPASAPATRRTTTTGRSTEESAPPTKAGTPPSTVPNNPFQ